MTDGPVRPRALMVDDSRLILEVLRDAFGARGYDVDAAASAEDALEIMESRRPDVIVADILMPGIDGWALLERVRTRPRLRDVPFVFLTTEAEVPKRLRGLALGADDYVTKPFDAEELVARVDRIVARREELARARESDDGAVLAGSLDHLALPDVLQVLSLNRTAGVMLVHGGALEGRIVLEGGSVVHAACGPVTGTKALYRMLGWSPATFRVMPGGESGQRRTIERPIAGLVMDGLVSLDEWTRWRRALPPLDTEVHAVPPSEGEAPELGPVEREVVGLAGSGGRRIDDILDRSAHTDAELARALLHCLERGVLRARG